MSENAEEKKGMSTGKKVAIGMGVLIVLCALGRGGSDKPTSNAPAEAPPAAPQATAPTTAAAPTPPPPPPEPAAPAEPEWVKARKDACAKYEEAPNEIKKSSVFSDYIKAAKAKQGTVENVRATLSGLETPQGGDEVWLKVATPYGEFNNNDILVGDSANRDIKKGTPLYNTAGELAEGASITITAANIIPAENPFSERLGVCGDDWIVKFTKIEAVK